jgi:hypothetical protein
MSEQIKAVDLINQLRTLENSTLVEIKENKKVISKLRTSDNTDEKEVSEEMIDEKVRFIQEEVAKTGNQRMQTFINDSKTVSKIRMMITDPSCETAVCAGIAELYFTCIPDIFKYFPNIKTINCDYKPFKVAKTGRIETFGTRKTLATIKASGYTDITAQMETEMLRQCVTLTPEYLEGEIALGLDRENCGTQMNQLICYTVNTLDFIDRYLEIGAIKSFVTYLQSKVPATGTITATGTLYDNFNELSNQLNNLGYTPNKVYIANLEIIDRMSWEKNANGTKTFETLTIACGDNACKVVCLPNGSYVIGVDTTILPKTTGATPKFQILIARAEAFLGGVGKKIVEDMSTDLSILLNKMMTKTVGIKPLIFDEAVEFANKSVLKMEII